MKMKKILYALIILFIIILSSTLYIRHWRAINDLNIMLQDTIVPEDEITVPPAPMLYGFIEDSFYIESFKVGRNQNLASILLARDIEYSTIHNLALNCKDLFDVRKIRAGNPYTIFYLKDSLQTPAWMVYEIDKTDYLVLQLTDSLSVYTDKKEIQTYRKKGAGILESNLWNAMNDCELNPLLAIELSEIFAWTIDFFGIEKGDRFRVLYDEAFVDSISIDIEAVQAAHFIHKGKDFYAFHYKEDSIWSFFDEKGQSLKKAFLKAPLRFSRISSHFSNNRFHPVLRVYRPHHGVDYAAPAGTPVYAIGDGVVTHRGWDAKGGGNYIKIKHNSVYTTVYMHLQGFAQGLHKGQFVQQGQLIAYVGKTGLATGPHLDFRVFKNGHPINPLTIEAPPVEPIKEENMAAYLDYIKPLIEELEQLSFPADTIL